MLRILISHGADGVEHHLRSDAIARVKHPNFWERLLGAKSVITTVDGQDLLVCMEVDAIEHMLSDEPLPGESGEGEWRVIFDGPSYGMMQSPDGRIFRIQELGAGIDMWGTPHDNDELCFRFALGTWLREDTKS